MSAAFEFAGQQCGTDAELFEKCVRRAAEIASSRLGEEHAVAVWLNSAKNSIGDGSVLSIELGLPDAEDRAALGEVLAAVSSEGLRRGRGLFSSSLDGDDADELGREGDWARNELPLLVDLLRG